MYEQTIYCKDTEYVIETEGEVTLDAYEDMVYLRNEQGKSIFIINKDRFIAIRLKRKVKEEITYEINYADGEKKTLTRERNLE